MVSVVLGVLRSGLGQSSESIQDRILTTDVCEFIEWTR